MTASGELQRLSFYQSPSHTQRSSSPILFTLSIPFLVVGGIIGFPALLAAHYEEPIYKFRR
ncbi:MAG TPA: hypothetical protein PK079_03275 [Leptospiraceae bacterium]|nr:hypothetical protein [Leptospiraceae bacterium]HMW03775.1 hypothetical protein [Leptospiraceae bacterium]HMX34257.1 hypothetical protein [Leptospiraceae bacterium]HMY29755.1 hypothetical protein [Leptospiraceae bacterium]HMZ62846.1 hypothetical protein [Leptospiraceae bacterium]